MSPAPRPAHAEIVSALAEALSAYCRHSGIGRVTYGQAAVVTPESEVLPDIIVRERMIPPPERWDDAPPPMLLAEVLSDSTRRVDLVKKRAFYMEIGIPEYWIVDGMRGQ